MSKNKGTLVVAPVRPNDSNDLIATAFSNEIKGGYHGYETIADRDNLITARREWGMLVSIYNDGVNNGIYKLEYNYDDTDIDNNLNWILFTNNDVRNTWVNSVISKKSDPPLSPSDNDRYLIGTTASGVWYTNEEKITQYDSILGTWSFTTPIDGYSVVVNNETNSIYRYQGSYPSGTWIKQVFGGVENNYLIENETIEVPYGHQYFVYGDLIIGTAGSLTNYGQVITLNGDLIIESTGTFSNYGLYSSPSIQISKYSGTFSISPAEIINVEHNLNSTDLILSFLESVSTNYVPVLMDYVILDEDNLEFSLPSGVTSSVVGKLVIIT